MKRNVDPDFEFDKVRFAETLKNAIGDRSIAEFSRDAKISPSYISRYVNLKVDVTPTLTTIQKMNSATTTVSYEELLEAAGYDPAKYDDEADQEIAELSPEWSPMNVLMPALCKTSFEWIFKRPGDSANAPLCAEVKGASFDKWFFIPVVKEDVTKEDISAVLGSKAAEYITQNSKVTFLIADRNVFDQMRKIELPLISLRISVALVSASTSSIEDEEYMKTAIEVTEQDKKFVLTNCEGETNAPLSL